MIPIVAGALGLIPKGLNKSFQNRPGQVQETAYSGQFLRLSGGKTRVTLSYWLQPAPREFFRLISNSENSHKKTRILSERSCENEFYLHAGIIKTVFITTVSHLASLWRNQRHKATRKLPIVHDDHDDDDNNNNNNNNNNSNKNSRSYALRYYADCMLERLKIQKTTARLC